MQNFENYLCERNDTIDNAAYQLIGVLTAEDPGASLEDDPATPNWDMAIIGEVVDAVKEIIIEKVGFSFRLYLKGGLPNMNLNKPAVIKKLQERFRNVNAGRGLYTAFLVPTMLTMFSTRAFAADTIWTKASAIMQDVYTQILGISTIAAVVTAAIALLLMNFSRSGRTVDESRAWLKRIIITWAILNSLGFIMAYVTPFFSGGTWTP